MKILQAAGRWALVLALVGPTGHGLRAQFGSPPPTPAPVNTNASTDSGDDLHLRVVSDGAGTWIAVWASCDELDIAIGDDYDILFARSIDGGVTWSDPEPLNSDAARDAETSSYDWDYAPALATDGNGTWGATWYRRLDGDSSVVFFARSTDNGASWSNLVLLDEDPAFPLLFLSRAPSVATDGAARWIVAWHADVSDLSTGEADGGIYVARSDDDGQSWSAHAPLLGEPASGGSPAVHGDGAGNVLLAWSAPQGLSFVRSADGGATWTEPLLLNGPYDGGAPDLATDGGGLWAVAWTCRLSADTEICLARSEDDGWSWDPPTLLNPAALLDDISDSSPRIHLGDDLFWVATWGRLGQVVLSMSPDAGRSWSVPEAADPTTGPSVGQATVLHDGTGRRFVAWPSTSPVGGIGADFDLLSIDFSLEPVDDDGDGTDDRIDNCPGLANPQQEDADGDLQGDPCDPCPLDVLDDADQDGLCADVDPCPGDPVNDPDGDAVCALVDNCPAVSNPAQDDGDGDGVGDACDVCPADPEDDADGDGLCLDEDPCPEDPGNDDDLDGVCAAADNCPEDANPGQENADQDPAGDICDCAPADSSVYRVPVVENLRFADSFNMEWDGTLLVETFDVVGGVIDWMPVGSHPEEVCLANDWPLLSGQNFLHPAPAGAALYFVVRGANACGIGAYGADATGVLRASAACP